MGQCSLQYRRHSISLNAYLPNFETSFAEVIIYQLNTAMRRVMVAYKEAVGNCWPTTTSRQERRLRSRREMR